MPALLPGDLAQEKRAREPSSTPWPFYQHVLGQSCHPLQSP